MIEEQQALLGSPASQLASVSDMAAGRVFALEPSVDRAGARWIGPRGHGQGYAFMVIAPCTLSDGRMILLNLGWSKAAGQLPHTLPTRYVRDERSESPPWFNRRLPVKNIEALSQELGTEPIMLKSVEDHTALPNRHLEYIVTWYAMGALSVLFGRLRK